MLSNRTRSVWLLVLAAAAYPIPPAPAAAAPCLTHSEARAKWPDDHLWWHTDARCFDNHRYGAAYYEPHSNDQPSSDHPNTSGSKVPADQAVPGVHTTVYYPTLEVNAWPATILPMGRSDMSRWPLLFDVDQPTRFGAWRDRITGSWGGR